MIIISKNGSTTISTDVEGRTSNAPFFLCVKSKETRLRKSIELSVLSNNDRFNVFELNNDVFGLKTGSYEYWMTDEVNDEDRPIGNVFKVGILRVEK